MKPLPSVEYLNECLRLDAETGHLFWKVRPRHHFATTTHHKGFNTKHAGKRADRKMNNGYMRVTISSLGRCSTYFGAHRIVWKMVHGFDPIPTIDHIDRNPLNNRPDNLRVASRLEQILNSSRVFRETMANYRVEIAYRTKLGCGCVGMTVAAFGPDEAEEIAVARIITPYKAQKFAFCKISEATPRDISMGVVNA